MKQVKIAFIGGAIAALVGMSAIADDVKQAEALEGALVIKSQDAVAFVPVAAETQRVAWAKAPIKVDGDLADWEANGIKSRVFDTAQSVTWHGRDYAGAKDLAARLRLARDDAFFYVAVEIDDDSEPHPSQIEIGIAPANSPLITTWRDVGQRYGADDLHPAFNLGADGKVALRWAHVQSRMSQELVSNAFGNEEERRAFIEQLAPAAAGAKIFSTFARKTADGRATTVFECAFPWRLLLPYDPASYAPFNFNFVVRDADGGENGGRGMIGWKPGLAGTYSAAHFATLVFDPPAGRSGVDAFAQLPKFHYLNENLSAACSFHNHGAEVKGVLSLFDADRAVTNVFASAEVVLPPGFSRKEIAVHSEKLGKTKAGLRLELAIEGRPVQDIPVHVPALDELATIQPVQEVLDAIARIESNASVLSNLYEQVVAKGLDPTYPMAYWTLQQMFIARCKGDLRGGFSQLVLDNEAYLTKLFPEHKARMEAMLRDPKEQLKAPARPLPETLKIKDGFYHDANGPVFLWGPCVFWWMKNDQHYAWKLGFNSVGPELPVHNEKEHPAIAAYLENFRTNGMLVNASIGNSQFDELKKAHPEVANVDRNNFLAILIQHPIVRDEIKKRITKDIDFFKQFPGVRSYWLWNEPDYVNFSEMTRQDFIKFLKPKYKDVAALNARWKSDYKTFEDVQIARGLDGGNAAPWVDYQAFLNDLLADFFGFLHQTAKGVDPTRPTHTKYMCISAAFFDIEKLQAINDICGHDGNSGPRDLIFLDLCRSLYPDKPLSNTEIHIWYKDYFLVSLVPWRLALHGLADGNWWCWHANHRFSKTVGSAESMHALTIPALDIRRLYDPYMHALATKRARVATLFQDVVAGRSWGLVDNLRYQIAPAQYSLGVQPFYATEKTIAKGVLKDHTVLVAAEASFVKDATYAAVLKYARDGGTVVVLPQSFAANEYGDPRDTSELIPAEGGEPYGEGVRAIALGKGRVICIDQLDGPDPEAKPDNNKRQAVYRRVIDRAMRETGIVDPVRLVGAGTDPDALLGWDIRCAKVKDGYALCALPQDRWEMSELKLETDRPVKRIVNLITEKEVPVKDFKLDYGANLFRIELK
ncbi:MAG: beta-galactosidase [Kiritimatiellae bacterium]|nr:beta-galactosidase [Kiritimatiellia bacterium]